MKPEDLTGARFGRWTALRIAVGVKRVQWECECDCGNKKVIRANHLKSGVSKSCGCLNIELLKKRATHGRSRNDAIYRIWQGMIQRCTNPKNPKYSYYGGRGISVCDRWGKFENFLHDMGERPKGLTLDRFPDKNGNYELSNCRWATWKQQQNNRSNNLSINIPDLSETYGVKRATLYRRFHAGVPLLMDSRRRRMADGGLCALLDLPDEERAKNQPVVQS